ncbi:MAG: stage II sporulation protein M [Chloroflexota bacterium]
MKRSLTLATGLFILALAAGAQATTTTSSETLEELSRLIEPLESLSPLALALVIFLNNVLKVLGALVFGIALGIPSLLFVTGNGFILGTVAAEVASTKGYGLLIAGLVPHGVIEIPMLILGTAVGFTVGWESLKWIFRRESAVKATLVQGLKRYGKWIVIGLLIAAAIETFITPFVVHLVSG